MQNQMTPRRSNLWVLAWLAMRCVKAPWLLTLTIIATLAFAASSVAIPWLVGQVIDALTRSLVQSGAAVAVYRDALALLALATLKGLLAAANSGLGETLGQRVGAQLRIDYFRKLLTLADRPDRRLNVGDLIARGAVDIEAARGFAPTVLAPFLSLTLILLFSITMIVRLSPILALIASAFVPFALFGLSRMGLRLRKLVSQVQDLQGQATQRLDETVRGARVVRAFAGQAREIDKFRAVLDRIAAVQRERIGVRARGVPWVTVSFHAALALLLCLGGRLLAAGRLSPGQLMEAITYLLLMEGPVLQVARLFNNLAQKVASAARIFEVLHTPVDSGHVRGASALASAPTVLAFEGVSLVYDGGSEPVLRDIDFQLRLGQTLAVLGGPGSGKSSLAALASGRYGPSLGRVTIDGVDRRGLDPDALRRFTGATAQSPFLFDETIAANIAYAEPASAAARIEQAARISQIADDVAGMAAGYATRVGPGGGRLSGGQRQRVDLARTLLPDPRLLVLDDVATALDPVTRAALALALQDGAASRLTILTSSRADLARHADEIIVLDAGRIVERGRHAQLLALKGRYWRLSQVETAQAGDPILAGWS